MGTEDDEYSHITSLKMNKSSLIPPNYYSLFFLYSFILMWAHDGVSLSHSSSLLVFVAGEKSHSKISFQQSCRSLESVCVWLFEEKHHKTTGVNVTLSLSLWHSVSFLWSVTSENHIFMSCLQLLPLLLKAALCDIFLLLPLSSLRRCS